MPRIPPCLWTVLLLLASIQLRAAETVVAPDLSVDGSAFVLERLVPRVGS